MIKEYTDFLTPYFKNKNQAEKFVKKCENVSAKKQNAKFMLHQLQRLVTLADNIDKIKPRDSLKLLFLIICVEAIAKLHANYTKEEKSGEHVHKFFYNFCDLDELKLLGTIFHSGKYPSAYLNRWDAVNLLYKVRCSVVHEGQYWEFNFNKNRTENDPTITGVSTCTMRRYKEVLVSTKLTYEELRNIIVKGTIRAIEDYLKWD